MEGFLATFSVYFVLASYAYISTDEMMKREGIYIVSICSLCGTKDEMADHLFLQCGFSICIWMLCRVYLASQSIETRELGQCLKKIMKNGVGHNFSQFGMLLFF